MKQKKDVILVTIIDGLTGSQAAKIQEALTVSKNKIAPAAGGKTLITTREKVGDFIACNAGKLLK
jgi:hypothetical protein